MGVPQEGRVGEASFGMDELFFSTTDAKGHITACNPVFIRIAGYPPDEMMGRAHNIVRHPDMPRVVFRILWEHLQAGETVAAYVKNRTAEGRPYWVLATASPITGGHLSVRFKPSGPHFPVVEELYRELLAAERAVEDAGGKRAEAIEVSAALLQERLNGLGLPDYGAFMRAFLPVELQSRERALDGSPYWERLWGPPQRALRVGGGADVPALLDAFREAYRRMRRLFDGLREYEALGATLAGRSRDLTGDTRLLSLNAMLGASRLGDAGAALAVVAGLIGAEAERTGSVSEDLNRNADALAGLIADQSFRVSVGRLQAEMAVFFGLEAIAGGVDADREIRLLADALTRSVGTIAAVTTTLTEGLSAVTTQLESVADLLKTLAVLQLNGTIEASRVESAGALRQLFSEMRERLDEVRGEIDDLAVVASGSDLRRTGADAAATQAAIGRIADHLDESELAA